MAWNDERLDDLQGEVVALRTEMHEEFRSVRTEMHEEFRSVRTEMREGFRDVNERIDGLHATMHGLHAMMLRLCVAIMVGMAGLIATLIGSIAAGAL